MTNNCRSKLRWSPLSSTAPSAEAQAPRETGKLARQAEGKALTWPQYLLIRRNKRKWQNYASIPSSILGLAAGALYFGSLDTDPMKPIMGIDPFMFYGICTTACMGAGYIVGPSLGGRFGERIDAMDRQFYERISKNRVDVTLQSPTSERIGSLHQYRQWLRDQNKYRRKVVFDEQGGR
ncbi:presequence translocated-associated motor subunit PAM17 [Gymnopus androsaceus JB14]|uniref:Presequence translocated-associated motor subunit PAM17 n=1 Tax=Gymnopus androsaceus JB14 TaxID=1447944 RepID=A0A6A4HMW6_9AGAR|nr:presequence translocated-associated motor subunit PAM17 [Gymnopus androsaceus JB14]